jgi:5-methylcytosine-specific restriction endonuclease McrA
MTSKSIKKKRKVLWEADPHCCYCGVVTVPVEELDIKPGDPTPMNMATLDHVFSINHPFRDREIHVLACHECNSIKSLLESQDLSLAIQKEKTIKKLMIINRMIEFEKE